MAKWLDHLPFTSKVVGVILNCDPLIVTRTQSSCEKSISQCSAECHGFSLGTPVSTHRESFQVSLGHLDLKNRFGES